MVTGVVVNSAHMCREHPTADLVIDWRRSSAGSLGSGLPPPPSSRKVTLLPSLKKSLLTVVQNAKVRVTQAFLCLPCVGAGGGGFEASVAATDTGSSSVVVVRGRPSDLRRGQYHHHPGVEYTPALSSSDSNSSFQSLAADTLYQPYCKGDGCEHPKTTVALDHDVPYTKIAGDTKEEPAVWSPVVPWDTVQEGQRCFRQAKAIASASRKEAQSLRETVATTRTQLSYAMQQLWIVESGLHDHVWEVVDRETWTHYLLPSEQHPPTYHRRRQDLHSSCPGVGGCPPSPPVRYSSSSSLYSISGGSSSRCSVVSDSSDYLWEWSLV